jgi:DNA-binding NtrC family response regulator
MDLRGEMARRPETGARAEPKARGTVLIVEDEAAVRAIEASILRGAGFSTQGVGSGEDALFLVSHRPYEAILLDLNLPGMTGLELLEKLQESCRDTPFIVVTGDTDLRTAIECMRRGAHDFLTKPINHDLLAVTVEKACEHAAMVDLLTKLEEPEGLGNLLGRSAKMKRVFSMIRRAAPHDSPVLVLGESGCGKELAAREIHRLSRRAAGPLVAVSCANIQPSLQESEFFGHEKGAFTGADSARRGLFEAADGGTIFLDEIASCAPSTQAALLRVLQEGEIRRVGSSRPQKVDVRVIAATNADLETLTRSEQFRSDLYYRLSRVVIQMPPLRERPEDVVMLAGHLLDKACERLGRPPRQYSPRALQMLVSYRWPGNVREVENLSEKVALFTDRAIVRPADLLSTGALPGWSPASVASLEEVERAHIQLVLDLSRHNYRQAAHLLGIPRSTLYRKVRRFGLATAPLPEEASGRAGAGASEE